VRFVAAITAFAIAAALAVWGLSAPDSSKAKPPTAVQVQGSQYGDVLFDGKGFVLYLFTQDKPGKSRCNGKCA
jgi:predicted lipoprotein with Yx(FWY)xxD motif